MSGVWVFKKGEAPRLLDKESSAAAEKRSSTAVPRRTIVYERSGHAVSSIEELESLLADLGWERNDDDDNGTALLQFYKPVGQQDPLTLSLPRDFADFTSVHMRDLSLKNRAPFHIVET